MACTAPPKNLSLLNFSISNPEARINNIFQLTSPNLIFCSEYSGDISIDINSSKKKYIYCNDIKKYNNNSNINYKCYTKNSSSYDNSCNICGNKFFIYNVELTEYGNISIINCVNEEYLYRHCFNTCKTCEIKGNETHNNCLKCKDNFVYEINISNSIYKNCYINNPFDIINETYFHFNTNLAFTSEIYQYYSSELIIEQTNKNTIKTENKAEEIKQAINEVIQEFNKSDLEDGNDKQIINNDKVIILTTTDNQKNNEDKNNISMSLGECETI